MQADNLVREVQGRSAEIGESNVVAEIVARFQNTQHVGPNAVVAEQDVADAANERAVHRIFATPILRPEGSKAWQAHAMQGSNECTVRNTSSGSSGRANGVCSSEASY